MILKKVISGGQTGADRAGLFAAKESGIPTGGYAPKGYKTEDGNDRSLQLYGLVEHTSSAYPPRTRKNVVESDGTILFGKMSETGTALTKKLCKVLNKPYYHVYYDGSVDPNYLIRAAVINAIADWLVEQRITVLNVAGNRKSRNLGIENFVANTLMRVFTVLKSGKPEPRREEPDDALMINP